uniref:Pre-rRNA-processing protein RIX1 N-terminal domain-containing protein n=1 Tax=Rhizophora mucronata TaxID=61149 RepID=A0A2P2LE81_RHIMU
MVNPFLMFLGKTTLCCAFMMFPRIFNCLSCDFCFEQSSVDSQFVKVASCTSILELIRRLAEFPNAKKDGNSHTARLLQPVLKLLQEDSSEALWEAAAHLLCAVMTLFPASLHRHYDNAEAAIASKFFSGKCSDNVLKTIARCLALLPKSRGDEDSWHLMMGKILLIVNGYLTEIFHGLEEEVKWNEAVRMLVPPGEVPPHSLWGQKLLEETSDEERKRNKISIVSMLMLSCSTMLTTSYPVQVTIPVRSLLALVERVLMVDGSLPKATSPFVIATEQEFVCSELPILHLYSLELLISIIKGMRSQLLPHAAYTVQLVKKYFRRCGLPDLRKKLYSVTKMLLISMGIGIAIYLAQEVVNNSFLDLVGNDMSSSAHSNASSKVLLQPCPRKRKHDATRSLVLQQDVVGLEMEAPKSRLTTHISVKIAALEALETLLTVGGALRSESWRSKVDTLLITIATDCCKWGWATEERNKSLPNADTWANLQLSALRALLASLLSPSCQRPPHLARGLELFQRGRQETGTQLSEFCVHALLALEVLIHPRALPLADFPSANSFDTVKDRFPATVFSGSQMCSNPFSSGMQEAGASPPDSDDDLYETWLGINKDTGGPVDSPGNNVGTEEPSEAFGVQQEEMIRWAGSLGQNSPGTSEQGPTMTGADGAMETLGDGIITELRQIQESMVQLQEPMHFKHATNGAVALTGDHNSTHTEMTRIMSAAGALDSAETSMASVEAVVTDKGDDGFATRGGDTFASLKAQKGMSSAVASDDDLSTDSIPDIVDADPDSVSEQESGKICNTAVHQIVVDTHH